jgi:hypothetical protein
LGECEELVGLIVIEALTDLRYVECGCLCELEEGGEVEFVEGAEGVAEEVEGEGVFIPGVGADSGLVSL